MLVELRVENLAVIERAEARFGGRFNAITGETGAGKSVLLSALGLALGVRADPDLVRRGSERALSSAVFQDPPDVVAETCRALGVVVEETLVLTRELSSAGRGGARANGATVPATALRDMGTQLVDVQGQGASSLWLRESEQRSALDNLGGETAVLLLQRMGEFWSKRQEIETAIAEMRSLRERQRGDLDRARLDLAELDEADPQSGEDVRLQQERDRLAHSGRLREAAAGLRSAVSGAAGETGAADRLAESLHAARGVHGIDHELDSLLDQAEEGVASLRELQLSLSSYVTQLPDDSARLAQVEERLDLLERLARRHGGSLESALARREEATNLLHTVDGGEGDLARLAAELTAGEERFGEEARRLSALRTQVAETLARAVTGDLRRMLMPKAAFQVRIWQVEDEAGIPGPNHTRLAAGPSGWDKISFDLSANPGDPARPLSEVASGGELSRVALALLSHLTRESGVSTVVFDEIDQGLGGEAANRVGDLMREVADHHQVICITHLAPIAARADTHLVVAKSERQGRPFSEVTVVAGSARVEELARLLAGEATPGAARAHAEELLSAVGSGPEAG
ncbi:MAG TPA: DNA repair protein RecN [Candidatus Dormibacteraeota bacterium]|nr:DNA repair protein RecN [Candidatus Dormibacteraeota bacterium]